MTWAIPRPHGLHSPKRRPLSAARFLFLTASSSTGVARSDAAAGGRRRRGFALRFGQLGLQLRGLLSQSRDFLGRLPLRRLDRLTSHRVAGRAIAQPPAHQSSDSWRRPTPHAHPRRRTRTKSSARSSSTTASPVSIVATRSPPDWVRRGRSEQACRRRRAALARPPSWAATACENAIRIQTVAAARQRDSMESVMKPDAFRVGGNRATSPPSTKCVGDGQAIATHVHVSPPIPASSSGAR